MTNYDVLKIPYGSSKDEVKKAFRKLAHIHHPDKPGGDEKKFKEINRAYTDLMKQPEHRSFRTSRKDEWSYNYGSMGDHFKRQADEMRRRQAENAKRHQEEMNRAQRRNVENILNMIPNVQKKFIDGRWWYTF